MKISKQNKIIRNKLIALECPGTLQMLVDFLQEHTIDERDRPPGDTKWILDEVARIAAVLKVRYINQLTPVEKTIQKDLETEISEIKQYKK